MKSTTSELVMDYHKDTKMHSDASSPTFNGKDVIDLTSYSVSDSIPESEMSNVAPATTVSPLRQTMEGIMEGYDPNRIPSSVFASKPSNHLDWSRASAEADSLFSITIGRNYQADWLYDYKRRFSQTEATNSGAIKMDSQTEADFLELKIDQTAGVEASEPTLPASNIPGNATSAAQENIDEKIEESEERTSPRVCRMLEPIHEDEINEDKASPVDRTTGFITMQGNQDLSASYKFRLEDKTGLPRNDHPNTTEIKVVEEDAQPLTVDQAPNASPGGWFSCFHCCISWKFVCCGCY